MTKKDMNCGEKSSHMEEKGTIYAACTSFSVFNRILLESIHALLAADSPANFTLNPLIETFVKRCDFSEHTYLYCQLLLHQAINRYNLPQLTRVAKDLAESAKRHDNEYVKKVRTYLSNSDVLNFPSVGSDITRLSGNDSNQVDFFVCFIHFVFSSSF
jgi:hypothetical protein